MSKLMVIGILAFALVACGPKPQDYAQADLIRQQAEAARIANDYQQQINEQEISLRATAAAAELSARLAQLEAERQTAEAVGQAKAAVIVTGGYALAVALLAVAVALAAAIGVRAWIQARMVPWPVDPVTRLPQLVAKGSWLINPVTGEVLSLRDAAAVDRFRAALGNQTVQIALLGRSAERIGRRDDQAASVLPGLAGNVRAVLPAEDNHA